MRCHLSPASVFNIKNASHQCWHRISVVSHVSSLLVTRSYKYDPLTCSSVPLQRDSQLMHLSPSLLFAQRQQAVAEGAREGSTLRRDYNAWRWRVQMKNCRASVEGMAASKKAYTRIEAEPRSPALSRSGLVDPSPRHDKSFPGLLNLKFRGFALNELVRLISSRVVALEKARTRPSHRHSLLFSTTVRTPEDLFEHSRSKPSDVAKR
jgi:hypothetical protein